ncbi:MAG: formylglycine-generating enzyme family protein [Leptolinea sp.]|jgi:formylglycine-generating enzyme required for sulfatase activity|nr:formylglycine-generating enzyme family protein [Leptolinea sp.]
MYTRQKIIFIFIYPVIFVLLSACTAVGSSEIENTPRPLASEEEVKPTETLTSTATATLTLIPSLTATITPTPTETFTPTPSLGIGSTLVRDADQMTMMYVPEGEFLMGLTDENIDFILKSDLCKNDPCKKSKLNEEKPQHKVYLDAFWIDQTEVTNAMFAKCVAAKACKAPGKFVDPDHPQWYGNKKFNNYPVVLLTWQQASDYCKWAGGSLPTEAQWEKAARGTDGRLFPWGNDMNPLKANTCDKHCINGASTDHSIDDGYPETSPVGSFPQGISPYGVLDMAGNVYEYILDWKLDTYYSESPYENPTGPQTPVPPNSSLPYPCHVLRGGAWDEAFGAPQLVTSRNCGGTGTFHCLGFRCVVNKKS